MSLRDFLRSAKWALCGGAVVGLIVFGLLGYQLFGSSGMVAGCLFGAVFGAVAGLDVLLGSARRNARDPAAPFGSFGAGIASISLGLSMALFGCYLLGSLTLACSRDRGSVHCSRVLTGWFGTTETGRQDFGPIADVAEGTPGQIVITTDTGERGFIEGFDSLNYSELKNFLASTSPALSVNNRSLSLYSPLLWVIGLPLAIFGIFCLGKAISRLRKQLATERTKNYVAP